MPETDPLPFLPELPNPGARPGRPPCAPPQGPGWPLRVARGLAVAACLAAVVALSALLAFQLNIEKISSFVLGRVKEATGLSISCTGVGLRLLPVPALRVDGVEVRPLDGSVFTARAVYIVPDARSILGDRPEPGEIVLTSPSFRGRLPLSIEGTLAALRDGGPGGASLEDLVPSSCSLSVTDGSVEAVDEDGSTLVARGLSCDVEGFSGGIEGSLSLASLQVRTPRFAAAAADVAVEGATALARPLESCDARLRGRFAVSPMSFGVAADVALKGDLDLGPSVEGRLRGSYVFDGVTIPWELEGSVSPMGPYAKVDGLYSDLYPADAPAEKTFDLRLGRISMGDDVLRLNGVLLADAANPAVAGRLLIDRLSLTRWLSFARDLCPGLQVALDRVSRAYIDFYIDSKTLRAPRIEATAADATFRGRGGIADLRSPEIFLDMTSDFVDLGRAIPESVGRMPERPDFGHRPLNRLSVAEDVYPGPGAGAGPAAPVQAAPAAREAADQAPPAGADAGPEAPAGQAAEAAPPAAEEGGLSYDIRLDSRRIHYGYLDLADGGVVITPGVNAKGEPSAKLDMRTAVCGGSCTGYAHFTGEDETEYEFSVSAKGVGMKDLRKAMAFLPVTAGTGSCQVEATSRGSDIDRFLSNLKGSVKVQLTDSALDGASVLSPFRADVTLGLSSAVYRNSALGLDGSWSVQYQAKGASGTASLKGLVLFGGEGKAAGVRCDSLPASLSVSGLEGLFPVLKAKGVSLSAKGRLSSDTAKGSVSLAGAHAEMQGISADGTLSLKLDAKQPVLSADLSSATVEVPEICRVAKGTVPSMPSFLKRLSVAGAKGSLSSSTIQLSSFSTSVAGTKVSGSISCALDRPKPDLKFALDCGAVDIDAHIAGKEEKDRRAGRTEGPWDFSFMRDFSAEGTLKVGSLLVKKFGVRRLSLPVSLRDGKLSVPKLSGYIYGGGLSGEGTATFGKGVSFQTRLRGQNVDIGGMLRSRGTKGIFAGRMDVSADLAASLTGPGQMPGALDGRIAMQVADGSYQAVDNAGKPKGKPTEFSRATASASIQKGVLSTKDFLMKGDKLTLTGEGWFDLGQETMDAKFVADMKGLPKVPLHLYGTFDKPKTSINGPMVFINAIGGIAKGFFSIINGMMGGILGDF